MEQYGRVSLERSGKTLVYFSKIIDGNSCGKKMIEENKFIKDGRERLRAVLEEAFQEQNLSTLLEHSSDAVEIILGGYELFAVGAHTSEYSRCDVEVRGLPYFRDYTEPLPLDLLLGVKWSKLRSSSLSRVEASYLYYLDYKATLWDNGELYPWDDVESLAQEALLDWLETGGRAEDVSRETRLKGSYSKYSRALQVCWEDGMEYEQLLEINPKEFKLPELKRGANKLLPGSREDAVLEMLGDAYYFQLRERNAAFVSIRRIAEEEGIPYSQILKALAITRKKKLFDE